MRVLFPVHCGRDVGATEFGCKERRGLRILIIPRTGRPSDCATPWLHLRNKIPLLQKLHLETFLTVKSS